MQPEKTDPPAKPSVADVIRQQAAVLGFAACGILPAEALEEEEPRLLNWLRAGYHGDMTYMERNVDKRLDPRLLHGNAKTVIVVLQNYFTREKQTDPGAPVISIYAFGTDYHQAVKDKLYRLFSFIRELLPGSNGRVFTGSAPILERAWARRAGLGWIGKNNCLIHPEVGSFVFLGEILLDVAIQTETPPAIPDHCGSCTRCLDACPTGALLAPRLLDARKCISYQTVELKGELNGSIRQSFGNRLYGCDRCQEVCPWNSKAIPHTESSLQPSAAMLGFSCQDWKELDETTFRRLFGHTPPGHSGLPRILKNLRFLSAAPPG